ncbi:MAG: hypothetical protein WD942_09805 [Dehalococcoidia bacterium]
MDFSVEIPLDEGFLRRECPNCREQFKWWEGDGEEEWSTDLGVVFCPYCGETATLGEWWTQEQLDYAVGIASGPSVDEVVRQLEKELKGAGGGLIDFSVQTGGGGGPPHALSEPSDMVAVAPPCHPEAPIKLSDHWRPPARCIVCGSEFSY